MTESIFKNHPMSSDRQSWSSVLAETKADYLDTLGRFSFRVQSPQSKECIEFLKNRPASYSPETITQEFISQFNVKKMLGESSPSAADMTQTLAGRGIVLPKDVLYSGRKVGTTLTALLNWHVDQRSLRPIDIRDLPSSTDQQRMQYRHLLSQMAAMQDDITAILEHITARFEVGARHKRPRPRPQLITQAKTTSHSRS
jgi:hypothetical protein